MPSPDVKTSENYFLAFQVSIHEGHFTTKLVVLVHMASVFTVKEIREQMVKIILGMKSNVLKFMKLQKIENRFETIHLNGLSIPPVANNLLHTSA